MALIYKDGSTVHSPFNGNNGVNFGTGTYHLADNTNVLYDVQRTNNFELIIPINGITGVDGAAIPNAEEIIRVSVDGTTVPHFTQNPISVRRGNNEIKFAGVPTFGSGSITLIDYIGANTKEAIMAWQNESYDVKTEKVGLVTDYKRNCSLLEYSPDYQLIRTWKMYGCWVSGISEDNFENENNNKKKINVTIEYDHAEIIKDYSEN